MDDQTIATFKQQLVDKQQELSRRADAIELDLQKPHSHDSAEQAQERENDEVLASLLNEAREELVLIAAALKRIETGDYGYCMSCSEAINQNRLAAYPEADKCIHCAA